MNTKSSPLVILLHYVGLLVMALFIFVGLSFLFGNVITGIVGAVLVAALVEILTSNLCKRKRQSEQSYNASTILRVLWGVYIVLFLLTAPVLLHGFSVGVVERASVEEASAQDVNTMMAYDKVIDEKIKAFLEAAKKVKDDAKASTELKNRINKHKEVRRNLNDLVKNEGEQLKETTLNPFNFLFFFERDLSEYNTRKAEILQELKDLGILSKGEVSPSLSLDVRRFDTGRIAWGASLAFLLIVHILILWQVYNISVSGPGKIRGGNSGPGVHTFGK